MVAVSDKGVKGSNSPFCASYILKITSNLPQPGPRFEPKERPTTYS